MDSGQNNYADSQPQRPSEPLQSQKAGPGPVVKKRSGWKIFWGIFTGLSVLGNIILLLVIIGMGAVIAAGYGQLATAGQDGRFSEHVLVPGSRTQKVAVIAVQGIIRDETADEMAKQVKMAGEDNSVRAVIVRINSPGGTVSASDRINHELRKLWDEHEKPTVAFMQGIAASGGYYSAVACQRIVAEPTAITGSIGVIMETFVVQGLLEEKLGIQAVVLKSGEKKDWPNPFKPVTDEQKAYLQEKLIKPAYDRFVTVVAAGRKSLSEEQVRTLADGSIYGAQEACSNKLVDEVGYFDKAVSTARTMGKAENAQVVEYRRVWSLGEWLGAENKITMPRLDRQTLTDLSQPQLLYLWKGDK
jgi:protease-4